MYKLTETTLEANGKVLGHYDDKVLIGNTLHLYFKNQPVMAINSSLVESAAPEDKPNPEPVRTTTLGRKKKVTPK